MAGRHGTRQAVLAWLQRGALGLCLACATLAAQAQTLLRDPDIEKALADLARPLLQAAGLSPGRIKVLVVKDSSLNAFVASPRLIVLHSGLILKLQNADELQAVIAHEAAHIANGHLARRLGNLQASNTAAALGLILSAATAAATGDGRAAAGIALGTQSSAQRLFFAHTRAEEASADQAALRYMAQVGIDPRAMERVLDVFRGQEALSAGRQDPYVRSHPLTRDRLRAVKGFAAAYGGTQAEDPAAAYQFARARAKLSAFLRNPSYTLRRIKRTDKSALAEMTRAIAYHRRPDADRAIAAIGRAVALRPSDAYLHELRGQILLESRQPRAAVSAYARAAELAPREPLIQAGLGRALLALGTTDGNRRALRTLEAARARDNADPRMLRDLAVAYAKAGQTGMASLVTGERYAITGRLADATVHATRASDLLARGSPGWRRAQDLLSAVDRAKLRR